MFQNSESDGTGYKDLGRFSEDIFIELVENLPLFHIEEKSIGILRDNEDHISISKDSSKSFRLSLELLRVEDRSWKRLLRSSYVSKEIHGLEAVREIVKSYTQKSRSEFEHEYT